MTTTAFHIIGSQQPRPRSQRTLYLDGGRDEHYRDGIDLELSHWIPNTTPERYKADTSTEIALNFVADGNVRDAYDLAVNNHVDVDGLLSMFVAVNGASALAHRRTLVQAAEMGDFWAYGDVDAQRLCQSLILLKDRLQAAKTDVQQVYADCLRHAADTLAGAARPECDAGLAALQASLELIDGGRVKRDLHHPRFVQYTLPWPLADGEGALARCLAVPRFNMPFSGDALLWPHARARLDRDRMQLVSVATPEGWHHDLWAPGHSWADTPGRWRLPGLASGGDSNVHLLDHPRLTQAAQALQRAERSPGQWSLAERLSPFQGLPGRGFPVVLGFVGNGVPAPSALAPEAVAEWLAPAFA